MADRNEELGEREIAALFEENTGNKYTRQHRIAERAFEAKLRATEKPFERCAFRNLYGFCKLETGHKGSHTVIFLGNDGEEIDEEQERKSSRRISPGLWITDLGITDFDPDREGDS